MKNQIGSEHICQALVRLYERLLRLYPRSVRDEYGPEMAWVFARGTKDAARQGWGRLLAQSLRELRDLPGGVWEAWTRQWNKRGLEVSGLRDRRSDRQERIRWAPRLPQAVIVQLYAQDAQGIVDKTLIGWVGAALDARAESMLLVSRRQIRCPRCEVVFDLGDVQHDEDIVRCPEEVCGWETTFRTCRNSWRRRHLFSGSLLPLLEEYRVAYAGAESPQAKLQLIDQLLHAFGRDPRTGEIQWPSVGHFVEGKSPKSVALLESLTYGKNSTPGLEETKQQWLEMLHLRRGTVLGEQGRCGA